MTQWRYSHKRLAELVALRDDIDVAWDTHHDAAPKRSQRGPKWQDRNRAYLAEWVVLTDKIDRQKMALWRRQRQGART